MVPVGPFLPFGRGGGIMPGGGVMEQGAGGQVLGMAYQVVLLRVLGEQTGRVASSMNLREVRPLTWLSA